MSGAASAVALGSSVASMSSGMVGSYYSAKSQQSSLEYQARMSRISAGVADTNASLVESLGTANAEAIKATGDFNASIAELGAQSALSAGQQQIATQTLKAGQLKSSQRAAMAANGVALDEGSAAEVQQSGDIVKGIDMDTLRANAARAALGYRVQGMQAQLSSQLQALNTTTNAKIQAMNLRTGAGNANISATMNEGAASGISPFGSGAVSLLGGAGDVAKSWYAYNKTATDTRPTLDEVGASNNWWGTAE
ncbi:hypothetical protein [Bordetella hinzii]|uniref:hypothetical protein n=1 Tax=Bordetella hinzii TaxID=103855 RepID=UPI001F0E8852|nr:hypothetical protein [Bordetella hinzii]